MCNRVLGGTRLETADRRDRAPTAVVVHFVLSYTRNEALLSLKTYIGHKLFAELERQRNPTPHEQDGEW